MVPPACFSVGSGAPLHTERTENPLRTQDRIAVAWCDPGQVDGAFAADMMNLAASRRERLAQTIRVHGGGLLSRTRNQVVAAFLGATDAAWLWMVDSDHRISLDTFDLLVAAAHDKSHPVVAGLYFGAYPSDAPYPRPVPIAYDYIDGSFTPVTGIEPRGLRRVDGAGTGCLLVHRDVLQQMRDDAEPGLADWCWFQDGPIGDGRWLSEDLTFCKRLMDRGVPLHVHTGAVLPHHKQHWESDQTYALWRPSNGSEQR